MEYREIVSVTGIGGLFQLVTTKSDGAIVRNITDKSTKFISARKYNVTPLESIEIYTVSDNNVRLHEVFTKMQEEEAKNAPVDAKKSSNDEIKGYFNSIFPELDSERVYVSDMKKILKWYILLKDNDLLHFENVEEIPTEEEVDEAKAEEAPKEEKAPAKKATKKKAAKKAAATDEEKPAKKTATKKKAAKKSTASADKPAAKKTAKKKTEE